MKLREPGKIAFEIASGDAMDRRDAAKRRAGEFWDELTTRYYTVTPVTKGREMCPHCLETIQQVIRNDVFAFLRRRTDELAAGERRLFNLPSSNDEWTWSVIKFIVAFRMSFEYQLEDGCDVLETDYLDAEGAFRFDVVKMLDAMLLEGATLAKRIGSDTYRLWTDSMIRLQSHDEKEQHPVVDEAVEAFVKLWADLRTWIHMKKPQTVGKTKVLRRKGKK